MNRLGIAGILGALVACSGGTSLPGQSPGVQQTGAPGSTQALAAEPPDVPLTASDLGRTWVKIPVPHANRLSLVARSSQTIVAASVEELGGGGKVVGATYDYLYRSDDGGRSWHRVPSDPGSTTVPARLAGLAYGAGRWVITHDKQLWTSSDLASWSNPPGIPGGADAGRNDTAGPGMVTRTQGKFFALGLEEIFSSDDGASWSRTYIPILQARGVAAGNGTFVVAGAISLRRSTDGISGEEHDPACTPGSCVMTPPGGVNGGQAIPGPFAHVAYLDRFYVDHFASADGVTWTAYDGPIATEAVGGYLFSEDMQAWKPGEAPHKIVVDTTLTSTEITHDAAPDTITTALPGGETCLDHTCVIVGQALYLLR